MYKCNLTNKDINHGDHAFLTFIMPTKDSQEAHDYINYLDDSDLQLRKTIYRNVKNHIYYYDSEYGSTRLGFDVIYKTDRFEFVENDSNIKALSNLINLLNYDFVHVNDTDFIVDINEDLENDIEEYEENILFSANRIRAIFDLKEYELCFNYIVNNIENLYTFYYENLIKIEFNLISRDAIDKITSEDFTWYYHEFLFADTIKEIEELGDAYSLEDFFEYDNLFGNVKHMIPSFALHYNIEDFEDFKNVMYTYSLSNYIELVMEEAGIKLLPAVKTSTKTDTEMLDFLMGKSYEKL